VALAQHGSGRTLGGAAGLPGFGSAQRLHTRRRLQRRVGVADLAVVDFNKAVSVLGGRRVICSSSS
jgi:hypothetical protein